jgi:hypothetical protein
VARLSEQLVGLDRDERAGEAREGQNASPVRLEAVQGVMRTKAVEASRRCAPGSATRHQGRPPRSDAGAGRRLRRPHLLDALKDESGACRGAVEVLERSHAQRDRDLAATLRDAGGGARSADAPGTLGGPEVVDAVPERPGSTSSRRAA